MAGWRGLFVLVLVAGSGRRSSCRRRGRSRPCLRGRPSVVAFALAMLARERPSRASVLTGGSAVRFALRRGSAVFAALKDDLPRRFRCWVAGSHRDRGAEARPSRQVAERRADADLSRRVAEIEAESVGRQVMRVSAVETVRRKEGFWKRRSRKSKWKARRHHRASSAQDLDRRRPPRVLGSAPQPEQHAAAPVDRNRGRDRRSPGVVGLRRRPSTAQHLLGVMKLAYDHVTSRPASSGGSLTTRAILIR